MQISDLFRQYSQNTNTTPSAANIAQSDKVGTLTSTIASLKPGSIFEGNVTAIKGGNVLLALSNGQTLNARLDNSVRLNKGESMFFQVKSNENGTIAIRPYTDGNMSNPILKNALDAAGIPINERNIEMVNTMMKENMSINAENLSEMYKTVSQAMNVSVDTAVEMTKLDIPVTPENASQFENYKNDSGSLMAQMEDFFNGISDFLTDDGFNAPTAIGVNHELLSIITEGMPDTPVIMPEATEQAQNMMTAMPEAFEAEGEEVFVLPEMPEETGMEESILNPVMTENGAAFMENMQLTGTDLSGEVPMSQLQGVQDNVGELQSVTIGNMFDDDALEVLADNLRVIGDLSENDMVFDSDGNINKNLTSKQLLSIIDTELLKNAADTEKEELKDLFGSHEYKRMMRDVLEEQWTLKPSDVKDKDSIKELYEKMDRQLDKIDRLTTLTNQHDGKLATSAVEIKNNMNFMNDVNQAFTYVQIPLKMSGQNASGDLYVYTNKKNLKDPEGELSAFLHLDMDNLGSTDVSVKMLKKNVKTDFFLKDDISYRLIEENMPILKERLNALGFSVEVTVSNEDKKPNFVTDFLEKDMAKPAGQVHRYSFDVRA